MGLGLLDPAACLEVQRMLATNGNEEAIPFASVAKTWSTERNRKFVGNGTWYDRVGSHLELTAGERGCAASHVRFWKKAAKSSQPLVIVEDVAVPVKDFGLLIRKGLREAP